MLHLHVVLTLMKANFFVKLIVFGHVTAPLSKPSRSGDGWLFGHIPSDAIRWLISASASR
jgi:hypothetical protein